MKNNQQVVAAELRRIAEEHGGILQPSDVVESAKDKASPIHSKFEWDDNEAAGKYRLWQARQLISVTVEYIGSDKNAPVSRVFVSLTTDRNEGGYRSIESVMGDRVSRQRLLNDAMEEMDRFQKKYESLKELSEVFTAMSKARKHKVAA
jgi:hypothetical protein